MLPAQLMAKKRDSATETVEQSLRYVGKEEHKVPTLRRMLAEGEVVPPALLFVETVDRARDVLRELLVGECLRFGSTSESKRGLVVTDCVSDDLQRESRSTSYRVSGRKKSATKSFGRLQRARPGFCSWPSRLRSWSFHVCS
jgi:superfamily II DNA/RNA helicase